MRRTLAVLLAAAALSACRAEPASPPVDTRTADIQQAEVGHQFTLRVGREARVGTVRVKFAGVADDSRCPMNAICVWQGNARIRLELSGAGESAARELNTFVEPVAVEYGGYTFTLVALTPYPIEGGPTPAPNSHEATLLATR